MPLLVTSFATVFSHSIGCLFIFLKVFFIVQKLVGLIRSHLFIFDFVSIVSGAWPKKTFVRFIPQIILPIFSSRRFYIYIYIYTRTHTYTHTHIFRTTPMAYESTQARGQIGATAASLHHSYSNLGSEPHLWPTPQLMAMLDPQPTKRGQGWNPHPHGS